MRRNAYADTDYQPQWLETEEISQPFTVIDDFFSSFRLPDCRYYLWEMLNAAIASNENAFPYDFPPSRMLFFFESTVCLIEAVYLMHQQANEKKKPADTGTSAQDAV